MKQSTCSAVICQPSGHKQKHDNNFLKACLAKHVSGKLEWDEVTPLACAAYNFMPNENSRESPFFLMFA